MTSELINKINQVSKKEKLNASKNYRSNSNSSVPYEELVVESPDGKIYLVHKNMIFGRSSICDSSYTVFSFDENGNLLKQENVEELGRGFFRTMKIIKKI